MSYYTKTGNPANNTRGLSTQVRAEFAAIESGFTQAETAINLKAPTASPAFTGVPTAPTAAADTSTTQVATTAFVQQELIGAVIGGIPGVGLSNCQIFTANGTFTPAAGVTKYLTILIGGGGSGRKDASGSLGGNGGATVYGILEITAEQSVTIGGGGTAATVDNTDGSDGTASSIGSIATANGGKKGGSGTLAATATTAQPTTSVALLGGTGSQSSGGASFLSGGASKNGITAAQDGKYGSGGSAGINGTYNSGAGGDGVAIFMW